MDNSGNFGNDGEKEDFVKKIMKRILRWIEKHKKCRQRKEEWLKEKCKDLKQLANVNHSFMHKKMRVDWEKETNKRIFNYG